MQKLFKSPNIIFKYLTAAVIMGIILYPKFPFLRLPGIHVAIRLEDFLLAAIAIICGFYLLPRARSVFSLKIEKAILIYLAVGFISLLSAIFLTRTVDYGVGILHWIRRIEYFIPFFLGVLAVRKKENLGFYLNVLMLTLIIVFLYGAGQKYLHWPIIVTQNLEYAKGIALRYVSGSHINSSFAGHYDLATFLTLVLPIFISLFFIIKKIKPRIILGLSIFSGLWLLLASISRISIVSYLVGSVIALFILKKYRAILLVVVFSLVFFSFSVDLRVRYLRIIDEANKRLGDASLIIYAQESLPEKEAISVTPSPTPIPLVEDRSSAIRLNVEWPRAIRAFTKNPLLGTGYSSITLATDNDYLRVLGETGILGFIAFGLIFLRLFKLMISGKALSNKSSTDLEKAFFAGIIGGSVGVLINALFIDVFEASKFAIIYWLLTGLMIGLIRKEKYID